jgi:hypothetical protein
MILLSIWLRLKVEIIISHFYLIIMIWIFWDFGCGDHRCLPHCPAYNDIYQQLFNKIQAIIITKNGSINKCELSFLKFIYSYFLWKFESNGKYMCSPSTYSNIKIKINNLLIIIYILILINIEYLQNASVRYSENFKNTFLSNCHDLELPKRCTRILKIFYQNNIIKIITSSSSFKLLWGNFFATQVSSVLKS